MVQIRLIEKKSAEDSDFESVSANMTTGEENLSAVSVDEKIRKCWDFRLISSKDEEVPIIECDLFCGDRLLMADRALPMEEAVTQFHEALERLERQFSENLKRYELFVIFEDAYLMTSVEGSGLISAVPDDLSSDKLENLLAACTVYKGLHRFLTANNRFEFLGAHLCHLYACWQWFNLIKHIYFFIDPGQKKLIKLLLSELKQSYRLLTSLLADSRFAYAANFIGWWTGTRRDKPMTERLRLSMVLVDEPDTNQFDMEAPIDAPGVRKANNSRIDWTRTRLHPAFIDKRDSQRPIFVGLELFGSLRRLIKHKIELWQSNELQERAAINRLIRDWLVPRYDLLTPMHLAALLKREGKTPPAQTLARTSSPKPLLKFFAPLFILPVINYLIVFAFGFLGDYAPLLEQFSKSVWPPLICVAALFYLYVHWFDLGLLSHLALPRILGGISAGYFVLIIEDNNIAQAIWGEALQPQLSNSGAFWLLASFSMIASAVYFYIDAQRIVINVCEAAKRATLTLAMTVILALGIGLAAVALSTAAYKPDTAHYLMTPFGKVDLAQYLAFAPLAMLAGLILQLIWQDRSAGATVGTPEAF